MNNFILNPINIALLSSCALLFFILLMSFLIRGKRVDTPDKFEQLYQRIKEDLKYSVSSKTLELSLGVNDLVDHAVEIWRMEQRINKSSSVLPENQLKGLENSLQKMKRYLEKYDIEIVDYKNAKYNDGLNLEVLSIEKDPSLAGPLIKETVEPTIICKGQVVRRAKIILITNH